VYNNVAENAILPCAFGRKRWLLAGVSKGAEASATFFTLIKTATANGLDSYSYFRNLFEKPPFAESEPDYKTDAEPSRYGCNQ